MSRYRFVALTLPLTLVWTFSCIGGDEPASSGEEPSTTDASTHDVSTRDVAPSDAADASPSDAAPSDASDASPSDASTADAADAGCPLGAICDGTYNYAFVTSTTYSVTELGGEDGADAKCNDRAQATGLPGEYVAWLSSTTSNARARLGTASGWLRTDRRPFADSADDLFEAKLRYPLALDESGTNVGTTSSLVLTGTLVDGTVAENGHCSNWMVESTDTAETGDVSAGNRYWTTSGGASCKTRTRIYCLGKDHATPLPSSPVIGRRAFTSAAAFTPSGLAQADALCQSEAAPILTGTYKALLATTTASAISRFSTTGATWVRPDGVALWETAAAAAANAPLLAPPVLHADGAPASEFWTWVGAPQIGAVGTSTCADWAVGDGSATGLCWGNLRAGPWSTSVAFKCNAPYIGLICLEE